MRDVCEEMNVFADQTPHRAFLGDGWIFEAAIFSNSDLAKDFLSIGVLPLPAST
jgi:hypothetical protein